MKFNSDQLAVIEDKSPYVQVIAGAGAGKTSTMIGILDKILREKYIDTNQLLVVTFSRKAANEFKERLTSIHSDQSIRIQTFHAYCLGVLKNFFPDFQNNPPSILSQKEKDDFFRRFFTKHRFRVGGIPYKYLIDDINPYLPIMDPSLYEEANREFLIFKERERKLEFSDLVSLYLDGLSKKEPWTEEPKKRTRYIIVDEFQDTDLQQLEFLRQMEPDRLTVVGDDWQAIYGFRGATPEPFLTLDQYFRPLKRHYLSTNYRSLDGIVKLSQIPIVKNSRYLQKNVQSFRKGKANITRIPNPEGRIGIALSSEIIFSHIEKGENVILLCRTNFRIAEFQIAGIPEENTMTIHGAKGLEFHTVFVDLLGGWNQNPKTINPDTLEEERRILYVALSRAKDSLHLLGREKLNPEKNLEDVFFSYFHKEKNYRSRRRG